MLCKLNYDALKEIYAENLVVLELPKRRMSGLQSKINAFRGYIDGLTTDSITDALNLIQVEQISKVFVDGSNLGEIVKLIKQNFPKVEVCTFFHNVEAKFFWGALRQSRSLHAVAILLANYLAERKAVSHSDKIICLSERDSSFLQKLYGHSATHISAMAVQDKLPAKFSQQPTSSSERFALFVGGNFYANRAGITWFVENVVPRIGIKICIVGRGLDDLKPELESKGNVVVVGAVDNLAEWYANALFVISPIFDGAGMKTKVAEALMFGKQIVGSPETFSGYHNVADHAGWVCETADDFVAAIGLAEQSIVKSFEADLRAIYEEKYSFPAACSRLAVILGEDVCHKPT